MTDYAGNSFAFPSITEGASVPVLSQDRMVPRFYIYKMRGYYTVGATHEYWTSYVIPDLTNPSGNALVNKVFVRTFK